MFVGIKTRQTYGYSPRVGEYQSVRNWIFITIHIQPLVLIG